MRNLWAAVLTVWALLSLVAVLAWTRPPTTAAPTGQAVIVTTQHGKRVVTLAPSAHATTRTSPGAAGQPIVTSTGQVVSAPVGNGN